MNKIPVVFTFDSRIILAGAVALKSLIESASRDTAYDIFVFHPDIKSGTVKEFQKMTDDTPHSITFQYVPKEKFKNAPISKGSWREIVYYRLLIPELLPQYDKVIYSDVDVCFKEDLTELFLTDISEYEWAGVRAEKNSPEAVGHKYFEENKNEFIFWSGLMLINSKMMREQNTISEFYKTIENFKDRLKFFDLDTINITCNKILPLSLKYCLLEGLYEFEDYTKCSDYRFLKKIYSDSEIESAISAPAIIHYAGELGKPWRRRKPPVYYQNLIDSIPKKLRKYTFRDLRKKIFSKI